MSDTDASVVEALKDPAIRGIAADALGEIGPCAALAVAPLMAAIRTTAPTIARHRSS